MLEYNKHRTEKVYPSGNYSDPDSYREERVPIDGITVRGTPVKITMHTYGSWYIKVGKQTLIIAPEDAVELYQALGDIYANIEA